MKKTGSVLKQAREKAGFSLIEVSMATKINPKVLAAMENGDDGQLPARTFLRGFIRSYAVYLRLDPEALLKVYQSEIEAEEPKPLAELNKAKTEEPSASQALPDIEARSKTMKAVAIIGIILLIIVILVVRNIVEKYEREGAQDPQATASSVPMTALMAVPSNAPSAQPSPLPSPEPAVVPSVAPSPSAKPERKKREMENEIIVEALDKVTIKFQINDGEPTEVVLQPDQVHTIKVKGTVTLEASDGGAIDIIINGRDTGVPGDLGKPKQIKLP